MANVTTAANTIIFKSHDSYRKCMKKLRTSNVFVEAITKAVSTVNFRMGTPATVTVRTVRTSKLSQIRT